MDPQTEPEQREKPCHVLITHDAGELIVYGPRHVRPLIVNLPMVETVQGEVGREQLLDELLPFPYLDIHWPDSRRAAAWLQIWNMRDFAQRAEKVAVNHSLFGHRVTNRQLLLRSLCQRD